MSARSGIRRFLPLIALLGALAFAASSCLVVYAFYHEIPYQDAWGLVPQYREFLNGTLEASTFFITHNEHKITVLRLLALVDYSRVDGTGYLMITLSLLLQAAHALLIHRALGRVQGLSGRERLVLTCAAIVVLFWLVQSGNFNWNFQVAWFVNAFAATAAAYLFAGLRPESGRAVNALKLAGAALCCVLAAYGVANGLFIGLVVLPLLWKSRLRPGYWVGWLAFVAALWASYFLILPAARGASPGGGLGGAFSLETVYYVLAYLGNPITRFSLPAGMALGALGVAGFALFAVRYLRGARPAFFEGLVFAELAYVVVTAAITAVGRRDFGLEQASASRYYTTVLIFWLFLFLAVYLRYGRAGRARPWVRAGAAAAFFLIVLPIQALSVPQRQVRYVASDEAALALVTGVNDTVTLHYVSLDSVVWGEGAFMKARGLSIFGEGWTHAPGRVLARDFRVDSLFPTLRATLDAPRRVADAARPGFFVSGKIEGREIPEEIFFARGDTIVGVARTAHRGAGRFTGYVRGDAFDLADVGLYDIDDLDDAGEGVARKIDARFVRP